MYAVSVEATPTEGGTVFGGNYEEGTEVTVTATANIGYGFVNWTENGEAVSTEKSYTFNVTADRHLVANFEADAIQPLYVGNEKITEDKLTVIDANGGTATYDPETKTLTLNNFSYDGAGYNHNPSENSVAAIWHGGKDTLNLVLEGENTLSVT